MNLLRKITNREKDSWRRQVLKTAKTCMTANELCQRIADEIGKPIYPVESLALPSSGKLADDEDYFLVYYQPAPQLVSEMTILHELTHILFWKFNGNLGEEGEVERFAFKLFQRIHQVDKLFSPMQNSSVVARYESLMP